MDFTRPEQVLAALNATFPMEDHGGMYLTIWYGVFDVGSRTLTYSSAGHPPGLLIPEGREGSSSLHTPSLAVGMVEETVYEAHGVEVPHGSRLYLFSDGAYEVKTEDGRDWSLPEFLALLTEPPLPGRSEPDRIEGAVRDIMDGNEFPDDFSLLVLEFV